MALAEESRLNDLTRFSPSVVAHKYRGCPSSCTNKMQITAQLSQSSDLTIYESCLVTYLQRYILICASSGLTEESV